MPTLPVANDILDNHSKLLEKVALSRVQTLSLTPNSVRMLDQTLLPQRLAYVDITTPEMMVVAIQTMIVRGAPAIGIAGAYGVVLSVRNNYRKTISLEELKRLTFQDAQALRASRPTAVNLMWAIDALLPLIESASSPEQLLETVTEKASEIHREDLVACIAMGEFGAELLSQHMPKGSGILTHCNAGGLATAGYGTAVGVIRSLHARDNSLHVFADETRPRLQGARLTTWELLQDDIPVTLICDNMSASLMREGKVHAVVVGADRIASNGDAANKIGTYGLAIIAKAHNVPFYVVAPTSTFDMSLASGADIPIEHREPQEISHIGHEQICPEGTSFFNPAFDVTPAHLITAIISEKGVATPDYKISLKRFFE